ncbi:MAG: serine/threonine-protein kinase [Bacteroidota bacterium]
MNYETFTQRYRKVGHLGAGGFASVDKYEDLETNAYVAIKIAQVKDERFTLQREVELANKLDHRNVGRYQAYFQYEQPIVGKTEVAIMKFYEHGNLEEFLVKKQPSPTEKHRIIRGILEGIKYLHDQGIVHRDLKSQNILLDREDGVWVPKIIDFGLARESGPNHLMSNSSIGISLAYAAPEQIQNRRIRKNVDLWAVGVTVYRIIAGDLPFKKDPNHEEGSHQNQMELSKRIVNLELPKKLSTLPEPYLTIIRHCLVVDTEKRVQSAEELIEVLKGTASPTNESLPLAPESPAAAPKSRRTLSTVLGILVTLALLTGGGYYLWQQQQKNSIVVKPKVSDTIPTVKQGEITPDTTIVVKMEE